ncbi:MAG: cysteine--tRNA ligase [Clostridia bacterium]
MKLYNSLTNQKEELVVKDTVKIYACGPTVYNLLHIGNARQLIVFDTLRRYLIYKGNKVKYVQNFTDIDDKMINRAKLENTTVKAIADKYIGEYNIDVASLNVAPPDVAPKATEHINEIIEMIKTLVDKGFAYVNNGNVYFRTHKFNEYGKLSKQPIEDLESGARIEINTDKEAPLDFALWKAKKEGEPFWESPFGEGRPGWHIECSAMAKRHLGDTIDIHGGGKDLIFPHHENEIAQSECSNGCDFARFFVHNGFINIDNQKMSKSKNNFFTIRDIANQYGGEVIRFFILSAHYRSPINFTSDSMDGAKAALNRILVFIQNLDFAISNAKSDKVESLEQFDVFEKNFEIAMDDDLNTANAISEIFEFTRKANIFLETPHSKQTLEALKERYMKLSNILGLIYSQKSQDIPEEIQELVKKRVEARKNKDFKTSDEIRDLLKEKGYAVEDTKEGPKISKL